MGNLIGLDRTRSEYGNETSVERCDKDGNNYSKARKI